MNLKKGKKIEVKSIRLRIEIPRPIFVFFDKTTHQLEKLKPLMDSTGGGASAGVAHDWLDRTWQIPNCRDNNGI